jgi:hypothetical protein
MRPTGHATSGGSMTSPENAALRHIATELLLRRSGPDADAPAVAAAMRRASDDLARVLAPLIGPSGIDALAARTVHLVRHEYTWLAAANDTERAEGLFPHVGFSVAQQDPAVAAEAAAAVLTTFTGLLVKLIGQPLAGRLMRQAWPDDFAGATTQETEA